MTLWYKLASALNLSWSKVKRMVSVCKKRGGGNECMHVWVSCGEQTPNTGDHKSRLIKSRSSVSRIRMKGGMTQPHLLFRVTDTWSDPGQHFLISFCSTVGYSKANVSHWHAVYTHTPTHTHIQEGWRAAVLLAISSWYTNTKGLCVWRRPPSLSSFIAQAEFLSSDPRMPLHLYYIPTPLPRYSSFFSFFSTRKLQCGHDRCIKMLNAKCHIIFGEVPQSRMLTSVEIYHLNYIIISPYTANYDIWYIYDEAHSQHA